MSINLIISPFLDQVTAWAAARSDVLALALIGSHARGAARPDSDIDLVLLCEDPARYAQDQTWISLFGQPQSVQAEDYGRLISLRTWYTGGREVEFGLSDRAWAWPIDPGSDRVLMDGVRLLFERAPVLSPAIEDFSRADDLAAAFAQALLQSGRPLATAQYTRIWENQRAAIRALALRARLHLARSLILTRRAEEANLAGAILADCAHQLGPEHLAYLEDNADLIEKMGETPPAALSQASL